MTLESIFNGEGFAKQPAQFVEIVCNWASQNKYPGWGLLAWIEKLHHYSLDEQAQILVDWIDKYSTVPQRDSCIQFIMDTLNPESIDEDITVDDDSDLVYDDMGYAVQEED